MSSSRVRAAKVAVVPPPRVETDPDLTSRYVEDAAHFPGGTTPGVVRPCSIEELSACLRAFSRVLPVGAQSSLTGGATPMGDVILSTERLTQLTVKDDAVVAGAGVTLESIQHELLSRRRWFPPVPTYLGATVGGAVATCAAGAATFKYGAVRAWVQAITVVLSGGDVLELARGDVHASADGTFDIETSSGVRRVRVPAIRMPDVPKRSAGYFAEPEMDLVDLFIGCEGTLGAIASATLRTASKPAAVCRWFVPVHSESAAVALVGELRRQSHDTWRSGDACGIDISAIEHMDARSLELVREDGVDRHLNLTFPVDASVVLLIEQELSAARAAGASDATTMPSGTDPGSVPSGTVLSKRILVEAAARDLWSELAAARDPETRDSPIVRLCRTLDRHGALDHAEVAGPTDYGRAAAFAELREAVPAAVNRRIALARHQIDPRISKTAADMIVPFDRFADMMAACRRLFDQRGLELAVWGHISDGNVHPNLLPRSAEDVVRGRDVILELGREVIAMGGCPLAEHGVGRHPTKQALLRLLYGDAGIAEMRRVKRALDPEGRLAPGVIFASP